MIVESRRQSCKILWVWLVTALHTIIWIKPVRALTSEDIFGEMSWRTIWNGLWRWLNDFGAFVWRSIQSENIRYFIVVVLLWFVFYSVTASLLRKVKIFGGEQLHGFGRMFAITFSSLMWLGFVWRSKSLGIDLFAYSGIILILIVMLLILRVMFRVVLGRHGGSGSVRDAWGNFIASGRGLGQEIGEAGGRIGRATGRAARKTADTIDRAYDATRGSLGRTADSIREQRKAEAQRKREMKEEKNDRKGWLHKLRSSLMEGADYVNKIRTGGFNPEEASANLDESEKTISEEIKEQDKLLGEIKNEFRSVDESLSMLEKAKDELRTGTEEKETGALINSYWYPAEKNIKRQKEIIARREKVLNYGKGQLELSKTSVAQQKVALKQGREGLDAYQRQMQSRTESYNKFLGSKKVYEKLLVAQQEADRVAMDSLNAFLDKQNELLQGIQEDKTNAET